MTNRRLRTGVALAVAVAVLTATLAAPAAGQAEADTSPLDGLLTDSDGDLDERAVLAGIVGFFEGRVDALLDTATRLSTASDGPSATEIARDLTVYANERADVFVAYANGRVAPTDDLDTIALTVEAGDSAATRYVVGTHNASEWTGLTVTASTDRTVDERCTLAGDAARDAPDVLQTVYESYISTDTTPDAGYIGRLTGQYGTDVDCSFGGMT